MKLPLLALALSFALLPFAHAAEAKKSAKDAKDTKAKAVRHADQLAAAVKPSQVITYKRVGDRELKLHIFLPIDWKPSDKRATFITIHGGGWGGGDARRMYAFADDFAKRGMVGISVEYRLLKAGSGVTVFDCVQDGRSAVRYIRAHAADLGIDPAKIVANGGSAGGHVAVATAMFSQFDDPKEDQKISAAPNALVLYFPVIDTSKEGYGQAKIGERWKELSPAHNVRPGLPATLVFHGTGDTVTPFKGAELFLAEMKKAGNRCELDVNQGGGHGYLMTTRELYEDTLVKTEKFLREIGILSGPR